jgi:hypothetical protein
VETVFFEEPYPDDVGGGTGGGTGGGR